MESAGLELGRILLLRTHRLARPAFNQLSYQDRRNNKIYGTETWAMKADDLRSLERTERMMVRWMCGVSLKDRKRSEDLCNLLGINCVADVVRRGRLRWFGHLKRKSVDDWVSACRGLVVEGTRGRGRSRKTWEQCVEDDMKMLGLHPEWAVFRDMWRDLIWGKRLTLA